jgi:hypothetical protein
MLKLQVSASSIGILHGTRFAKGCVRMVAVSKVLKKNVKKYVWNWRYVLSKVCNFLFKL